MVEKELAIHWSNVGAMDPKDNKPTRVGLKTIDGRKLRFAVRSGEIDRSVMPWPRVARAVLRQESARS
jgi:large subunit ribosomal protein L24